MKKRYTYYHSSDFLSRGDIVNGKIFNNIFKRGTLVKSKKIATNYYNMQQKAAGHAHLLKITTDKDYGRWVDVGPAYKNISRNWKPEIKFIKGKVIK